MKKLALIVLAMVIVLLSSCANADYEPQDEYIDFGKYVDLYFDFKTLTFTDTQPHDILYSTGKPVDDYLIFIEKYQDSVLTTEQKASYQAVFDLFTIIEDTTDFRYDEVVTYTTQNLKDFAEQANTEITVTDIITFSMIKTSLTTMVSETNTQTRYQYPIDKISYIEYRLHTNLTETEIDSLQLLQLKLNELYEFGTIIQLKTITFEDLLLELKTSLNYEPTTEATEELETAYTIIQDLHNTE